MRNLLILVVIVICLVAAARGAQHEPVPLTFFGTQFHPSSGGGQPQVNQGLWPSVPFGSLRLLDTRTRWVDLNPQRGKYDWHLLDAYLDLAQQHGVSVLYTFWGTPPWASRNPRGACGVQRVVEGFITPAQAGVCFSPADMRDYDTFVEALVKHAGGRIQAYELWNEPNWPRFWSDGMDPLVRMAEDASRIIKSIDPQAIVLTPSFSSGKADPDQRIEEIGEWLDQFFAAGGGRYVDAVAVHGYLDDQPETILRLIPRVERVMAAHGLSGKPLWDTEASWKGGNVRLPDEDDQAAFLARYYLLHWSAGVQRFYWYEWNSRHYGTLWDIDARVIRKPGVAFGQIMEWMTGATMDRPCSGAGRGIWTCGFTRPGGYQAEAIWSVSGGQPYKAEGVYTRYRDLEGHTYSLSPGEMITIERCPKLLENMMAPR